MRDRNYLTCRQCHSGFLVEELESTIIGFICKECYSITIREELEDFLKGKGFRKPKFAAEQFLKAQEEIERDGMKKEKYVRISDVNKEIAKEWKKK